MQSKQEQQFQDALARHQAGCLAEAAELYRSILKEDPESADARYLLGVIAHQTDQPAEAVALIQSAIALAPDQSRYHNLLGLNLMALGRAEEAEVSFRCALAIDDSAEAYNNLGVLMKHWGRLDDALAAFEKALERDPGDGAAHFNAGHAYHAKGQSLQGLGRSAEAITFLKRAIELNSDDAEAWCTLGDVLQSLGNLAEADAAYQRSLGLNPQLSRAWYSTGCARGAQQDYNEASICFRRALELCPEWHEVQHNLAGVLFKLGQVEEAVALFQQAAAGPNPALSQAAIAVIIPGCASANNQTIYEARRSWAEQHLPPRPKTASVTPAAGKLRIGYVSSFFPDHNWMKPVWGLINRHDRESFEVHLFSDAPASRITHGYRSNPQDRFYDTTQLANKALSGLIQKAKIDLLVDLNGYSTMPRLPLFAMRPAPVVVGWFNMFATTGIAGYDYLIGDDVVIPPQEETFYCEKIVRVPGSYLTFEFAYPAPPVSDPPCLKKGATTFGCLAPQYKITPEVVEVWSRILQQVNDSSLLLKNRALASSGARDFVRAQFARFGVAPHRLLFSGPAEHYQFLETYGEIDIALDTFPYSGGTTTTEAIWQGVPVITFLGDRWVSRTSASILRAAGLGELVGQNIEEYAGLALSLAESPDHLAVLRRDMRARLRNSPVCDVERFARNMEDIYKQLWHTQLKLD